MSGDYTRFTFKPAKDYSGVFKQQGRVDLDADWNELVEIVDRRWRSETIDIIGHCVVPSSTPDAFLITPVAPGQFNIGIGRMYVDGIQVECHGLPPEEYQADLGEQRGTLPVPYSDQPYFPVPLPPVLAATPSTSDLVYLDVWEREVTILEDPSIQEIALGGPDTATRIQSVWQVRDLQNVGDFTCGDVIAAWDTLVAPSAGRLTTSAVAPPASDDPCIISPTGGFRGIENRLYRVEIHSNGSIGGISPAKFKWSRDNASIASAVEAIPTTTQITVKLIGSDQVLRFNIGDWIEISDDNREFQQLAGHTAQITAIDEANRILTFAQAIPGSFNFNAADPARHTRVRRWDQSAGVDANGLLDVVAGPIDLEDGVRVTFTLDPVGGNFKIGDFWVFAARTADGSVELLQNAPPRGILHHFCRLGFIHWGTDIKSTTFTDCRDPWPKCCDGCCTVTVGDGIDSHGEFTDIQQAINALGGAGGVVCIGRGVYTVTAGLVLDNTKKNVIIRGMGPATRIIFAPREGTGAFLTIQRTDHVTLEDVFVIARDAAAIIRIAESSFCRVQNCTLVNLPALPGGNIPATGLAPRVVDFEGTCRECELLHNAMISTKGVAATSGLVNDLIVRDNEILTLQAGVILRQGTGIEIVHNQLRGLDPKLVGSDAILNRGTINNVQQQVTQALLAAAAAATFSAAGVLIFSGNRVIIRNNLITAQFGILTFLLLDAHIDGNEILAIVGITGIFGVVIKVDDNFVLGLFAGMLQAGILAALDCSANEWVGINGIVWMSLSELTAAIGPILGLALGALGLGSSVGTTTTTGATLNGSFNAAGFALIAKIHRNLFFTFQRGIFKSNRVLSADLTIIDNTFLGCTTVGIELGGGGRNSGALLTALSGFVNRRHRIESNSLAVQGVGIRSSTPVTLVEQNSIACPTTALDLAAGGCTVRGNDIRGRGVLTFGTGLVTLHFAADGAAISDNQIFNAAGHSILLADDLSSVSIQNNSLSGARQTGIGTASDTTLIRGSQIAGNRIELCDGSTPANSVFFGGAITIGSSTEIRVTDNVVRNNSPVLGQKKLLLWFAIYLEDAVDVEVAGNTVSGNAANADVTGRVGAIGLNRAGGSVRVQNNVARGNGGAALAIAGVAGTFGNIVLPGSRMTVQNNHLADGPNATFFFVGVVSADSLVFEGNHCLRSNGTAGAAVELSATIGTVCGNTVLATGNIGMFVLGAQIIVNANNVTAGQFALAVTGVAVPPVGAPRAIVTSNIATAIFASSGVLVRANNLPLP